MGLPEAQTYSLWAFAGFAQAHNEQLCLRAPHTDLAVEAGRGEQHGGRAVGEGDDVVSVDLSALPRRVGLHSGALRDMI